MNTTKGIQFPGIPRGFALMMVLIFSSISLILLSGALRWTSTHSGLTESQVQYMESLAKAEAATEKVISRILMDFKTQGEILIQQSLESYRELVPVKGEHPEWLRTEFMDPEGAGARIGIIKRSSSHYEWVDSVYRGLKGMMSDYRIESFVRAGSRTVGLRQDIQLTTLPIFQFAVFYSMDLEIHPGNPMSIGGRVHSNGSIYCAPSSYLTFDDHVTASGKIIYGGHPSDPQIRTPGSVVFNREHDEGIASLTLPIYSGSEPFPSREILEIPPESESPFSQIGRHRYFNKSDLIIEVGTEKVEVSSGRSNQFSTRVPRSQWNAFLKPGLQFFDKRQNQLVQVTDLNIAAFKDWNSTNSIIRPTLGREISTIFFHDSRLNTDSQLHAVRLSNGAELPTGGLTVASPNPLYIHGDYNVVDTEATDETPSNGRPASIAADAITILSTAWKDDAGNLKLSRRRAQDTTIQAALISGVINTESYGSYGGGLENFPRLLENWQDQVLNYTGSMVALFQSRYALASWKRKEVFLPPIRRWNFNSDYLEADMLPPSTPMIPKLIRTAWIPLSVNDMKIKESQEATNLP